MKVYYNGTIITMEDEQRMVEILVEEDGRILFVGSKKDAETYFINNANTVEWIDLQGNTLLPAFLDAHSHISDTAMVLKSANLQDAKNYDDVISILKDYIDHHDCSKQNFVVGLSYDHNALEEGCHPDKAILDAAFPDIAIIIVHTSIHMGVANSKMLDFLGIDENTVCPEGGVIGRIGDTQEPNGYLEETAFNPVYELICKQLALTAEDIVNTQYYYMENGILTIQEGSTDEPIVNVCREAADSGNLVCDIVAYPCFNFGRGIGDYFKNNEGCLEHYCNHFRVGGYKVILDGSPQGRTAWMSQPYEGTDDFYSYPWLSDEELQDYVDQAFSEHKQILAHCNGDASSEQFINACESAMKKYSCEDSRPVMIHCQTVRNDQLDRMAKLGMIASFFVDHVYFWGDVHLKNFGPVRGPHISPVRDALDKGVSVNFHTDCPVTPPNLFRTLWVATTRITKDGILLGTDQCITVWEALKALTIDAAYAYFEENEKGSLKKGKKADLIIIDKNPLEVDNMSLKDIKVLACIKEGKMVLDKRI